MYLMNTEYSSFRGSSTSGDGTKKVTVTISLSSNYAGDSTHSGGVDNVGGISASQGFGTYGMGKSKTFTFEAYE